MPWRSLVCILVLQIMSSPLNSFFWFEQIDFPPNCCQTGLASICHFLVSDHHLKAMGPIYGSQPIGLHYFHWSLELGPHLKWPLRLSVKATDEYPSFSMPFITCEHNFYTNSSYLWPSNMRREWTSVAQFSSLKCQTWGSVGVFCVLEPNQHSFSKSGTRIELWNSPLFRIDIKILRILFFKMGSKS
jgi:hypothetical protein